jgi:aspartate aminotransferase-like enzyme
VARVCQDGIKALGLGLFADPNHLSETVTAIRPPAGVSPALIRKHMRDRGFVLAGGQAHLSEEIFRIGHLGFIGETDVRAGLAALAEVLGEQGVAAHG